MLLILIFSLFLLPRASFSFSCKPHIRFKSAQLNTFPLSIKKASFSDTFFHNKSRKDAPLPADDCTNNQIICRRDILKSTLIIPALATTISPKESTASQQKTLNSTSIDYTLSNAIQKLWTLDTPNRLHPGVDYAINLQGTKKPYPIDNDVAELPLFRFVNQRIFDEKPTYNKFLALLDNYSPTTCVAENVTKIEKAEEYAFLEAVMNTPVMSFCYQFCKTQQKSNDNSNDIPDIKEEFIQLLHKIWFKLYRRCEEDDTLDSCGFEHVFVGERRDGKVIGMHNWISIWIQESKGKLNYKGCVEQKSRMSGVTPNSNPSNDDNILTLQFTWENAEKVVCSSFLGVSPEFEFALYTMVFLLGKRDNIVVLDTNQGEFYLDIKCFKIAKGKVGSCYVETLAHQRK